MRVELWKAVVAAAACAVLALGIGLAQTQPAAPQTPEAKPTQEAKPEWKDRQEYDLYQSILKETDPQKKLQLLKDWTAKYPNTSFPELRLLGYLETHQALKDGARILETAKELIRVNPKNFHGLYWTSLLTVSMQQNSPDALATAEKAANGLAGILGEFFATDKKPPTTSEEAWKKARSDTQALTHRTLGWIAMQRKDWNGAEAQVRQNVQLNPADAEGSYWLGTIILAQKVPEKQSEALFHFARAATYDGPGALDPAARQKMLDYVTKNYTAYHGKDPEGLKQLLALARSQPFPPPDFKILSEAEVTARREEELAKQNPQLAFWLKLKQALGGPEGEQYFDGGMKGAMIPPPDQPPLKGTVISAVPAKAPKTVVLGMSNATTPEVTLKFETAMSPADPGTVIEFRGVASSFAKEPFMLTFDVEKKDLSGWPAPAPRRPATKKGTKK